MKELLKLSRKVLENYFKGKKTKVSDKIKKRFSEEKSCFVTLTKFGNLRGCIGSLYPSKALYKEVIQNTLSSAFSDPRFLPLTKQELPEIKIEISVLSIPEKINYSSSQDLLKKLKKSCGIIIQKNQRQATYLPQVWKQIPDKKEFLSHLCLKAGFSSDAWKSEDLDVFYYTVEKIEEK